MFCCNFACVISVTGYEKGWDVRQLVTSERVSDSIHRSVLECDD